MWAESSSGSGAAAVALGWRSLFKWWRSSKLEWGWNPGARGSARGSASEASLLPCAATKEVANILAEKDHVRAVHARRREGAAVPAARRVPWTAPPHTSARVAGSAVPAAGQVHAHPRHLRREGRRDLRVGLARRAGPPRTSAHLDAPRHTSAHLGRASAHPRHTGGKQTPRNTSAESRQIWRSLGTHLCTSPSPVAHPACKAGCGSPMTRPRRVHPTPQAVKEVRTSPASRRCCR